MNKCKEYYTTYSYYFYKSNYFVDSYYNPIKSIYEMVKSPYEIKPILILESNYFDNKRKEYINTNRKFEIKKNTKDRLINLLSKIHYKEIEDIEFQEQSNKKSLRLKYYDFYYTQNEKQNSFIFIRKDDKFLVYNLENTDKDNFENYMENENIIFDCYHIHFKN